MDERTLRGAVAQSSNGSVGIIHRCRQVGDKYVYIGISFNGNIWTSAQPKILAYSMREYLSQRIESEIEKERKSYLDSLRRLKHRTKGGEDRGIVAEVISCVNERAAERRELRKMAPAGPNMDSLMAVLLPDKPDSTAVSSQALSAGTNLEGTAVREPAV